MTDAGMMTSNTSLYSNTSKRDTCSSWTPPLRRISRAPWEECALDKNALSIDSPLCEKKIRSFFAEQLPGYNRQADVATRLFSEPTLHPNAIRRASTLRANFLLPLQLSTRRSRRRKMPPRANSAPPVPVLSHPYVHVASNEQITPRDVCLDEIRMRDRQGCKTTHHHLVADQLSFSQASEPLSKTEESSCNEHAYIFGESLNSCGKQHLPTDVARKADVPIKATLFFSDKDNAVGCQPSTESVAAAKESSPQVTFKTKVEKISAAQVRVLYHCNTHSVQLCSNPFRVKHTAPVKSDSRVVPETPTQPTPGSSSLPPKALGSPWKSRCRSMDQVRCISQKTDVGALFTENPPLLRVASIRCNHGHNVSEREQDAVWLQEDTSSDAIDDQPVSPSSRFSVQSPCFPDIHNMVDCVRRAAYPGSPSPLSLLSHGHLLAPRSVRGESTPRQREIEEQIQRLYLEWVDIVHANA